MAILTAWAESRSLPYAGIAVTTARKIVLGRGNIGKKEALEMISKDCRGVKSHDQADAIVIARAAASLYETRQAECKTDIAMLAADNAKRETR